MKKHALLVGINSYHTLNQLLFARQDAEDFSKLLISDYDFKPEEITLLTCEAQGTMKAHSQYIELALTDVVKKKDLELLIFGFWGHAFSSNPGQLYLCGLETIEEELIRTAVNLDVVRGKLAQVGAKNTWLILDCCRNSARGRGAASEDLNTKTKEQIYNLARDIQTVSKCRTRGIETIPTVIVMNSCTEGQQAYEWKERGHGVFTAYLLEEMQNGENSVVRIASKISNKVAITAFNLFRKEQTPFISFKGAADIEITRTKTANLEDVKTKRPEGDEIIAELEQQKLRNSQSQGENKDKTIDRTQSQRKREENILGVSKKKRMVVGITYFLSILSSLVALIVGLVGDLSSSLLVSGIIALISLLFVIGYLAHLKMKVVHILLWVIIMAINLLAQIQPPNSLMLKVPPISASIEQKWKTNLVESTLLRQKHDWKAALEVIDDIREKNQEILTINSSEIGNLLDTELQNIYRDMADFTIESMDNFIAQEKHKEAYTIGLSSFTKLKERSDALATDAMASLSTKLISIMESPWFQSEVETEIKEIIGQGDFSKARDELGVLSADAVVLGVNSSITYMHWLKVVSDKIIEPAYFNSLIIPIKDKIERGQYLEVLKLAESLRLSIENQEIEIDAKYAKQVEELIIHEILRPFSDALIAEMQRLVDEGRYTEALNEIPNSIKTSYLPSEEFYQIEEERHYKRLTEFKRTVIMPNYNAQRKVWIENSILYLWDNENRKEIELTNTIDSIETFLFAPGEKKVAILVGKRCYIVNSDGTNFADSGYTSVEKILGWKNPNELQFRISSGFLHYNVDFRINEFNMKQ